MGFKTISNATKILILFLFISVICSGCLTQSEIRKPETPNSSAVTQGLKDYSIKIINLKFKYPEKWTIHPNINATNQLSMLTANEIQVIKPVTLALLTPPCGNCDAVVFVGSEVLPSGLTIEQYYNERKVNLKSYWNASAEEIPVIARGNNQFYGLSYDYFRKGNTTLHHAREYIYIKNGIAVRIVYDAGIDLYDTYESAFETILSSFQ